MEALVAAISSLSITAILATVPPEACLANFRWEDCGRPPQPVMYYWKPGSRCEVGIWRGCLPSLNMFKDEYDCVSTCIFSVRAQAADYHVFNGPFDEYEDTTVATESTDYGSGEKEGNSTEVDGNSTLADEEAGTGDGAVTAVGEGDAPEEGGEGEGEGREPPAGGEGEEEPAAEGGEEEAAPAEPPADE